jgi:amino acid permease
VTGFCRIITVILLYGSTLFYLFRDGVHSSAAVDASKLKYLATAFGNTVFAFIFHHSISGIVYPIRP